MNNYQSQQFFNDLNGIIGFTIFMVMAAFMVGMVKPMGKFFEPPLRPEKHLPKPVAKEVTVPGGSHWLCVTCGKEIPPGTKAIKEGKVVYHIYCFIYGEESPEHHSNITTQEAKGICYEDAWRFLIKEEEGELIHGSLQLTEEGARIKHAWVELPTGYIWEPQTGSYFTVEGFKIMSPVEEHRYTVEEAALMLVRVGRHGPWTDEERTRWLVRPGSSNPDKRPFIGTCVDNPFRDIDILDQVIGPDAEEITKREFLNNTQASAEEVASPGLRFFKSRDYFWRSRPNVYFYRDYLPPHEYAGVEHFFSWRRKPK